MRYRRSGWMSSKLDETSKGKCSSNAMSRNKNHLCDRCHHHICHCGPSVACSGLCSDKTFDATGNANVASPFKVMEDFSKIRQRAHLLGLPIFEFDDLESIYELRQPTGMSFVARLMVASLLCIIAVVLAVYVQFPFTRQQLASYYVNYGANDFVNISQVDCLMEPVESIQNFARVPTDCDFCSDRSVIERESSLSKSEFERKFAYSGVPVIVTDATKNWSAPNTFSYDFLKQLYSPGSLALDSVDDKCHFFPYETEFSSLKEVFNMSKDRAYLHTGQKPWYIGWSNCDVGAGNVLRSHYSRPYFLPEVAQDSRTDWIFMGWPGYGAHMHIDYVGLPSWQAQLTGTKKWTFVPPPECYFQCPGELEAVVHAGEIIVVDTNIWFHGTKIVGDEMSITIGSEFD